MSGSSPDALKSVLSFIDQEKKQKSGYLSFFATAVDAVPREILDPRNLSALNLNECPVHELGYVLDLTNLKRLAISYTRIRSLKGLLRLTNLEELECSGLAIEAGHEEVLELRKLKKFIMNPRTSGRLGPVPREILSEGNENCLYRLRDYFDSLSGEVSGVTNVKLFIYGNGEVGKTQLLRCLCPPIEGPTFDVRVSTTHGVNVKSFSLSAGVALPRSALGVADSTNIKVRAWDFGGQDLYHGVHSLFLKDRAIHLVAWTPSREGGSSRDSLGYKTANHPLQYCLSFARHRRGDASALIVVQTQADNADDDYKWTPR